MSTFVKKQDISGDLSLKEDKSNKNIANGYAGLDATGKVASAQLPSYVDDVIEVANFAALPVTGETGKIYVTIDTSKSYRWSGTVYTEIGQNEVNSVFGRIGVVTAQNGDYTAAQVTNVPSGIVSSTTVQGAIDEIGTDLDTVNTQLIAESARIDDILNVELPSKEDNLPIGTVNDYLRGDKTFQVLDKNAVGLGNVNNTSDLAKPISTATQVALNLKAPINDPTFTTKITTPQKVLSTASGQSKIYEKQDDGVTGTYDGVKFGATTNPWGYGNKKDVFCFAREDRSTGAISGYTIMALRSLIDRYTEEGGITPRESTISLTRTSYNGTGIGASSGSETFEMYNNKYQDGISGSGIRGGLTMFKTGTHTRYRESNMVYYDPTVNDSNYFNYRYFPTTLGSVGDRIVTDMMALNNHNPYFLKGVNVGSVNKTIVFANTDINTTTDVITIPANTDIFTGMPAEISGFTTEPSVPNARINFAILNASGTVATTAGSNVLTGTGTFFTTQLTAGKTITFGQYAYVIQSVTNDTTAILTENAFATVSGHQFANYTPGTEKITNGRFLFVIKISDTQIKLASDYDNAMKGVAFDFATTGAGSAITLTYQVYSRLGLQAGHTGNTVFNLPISNGSNGQFLKTDGSGNTSWGTVAQPSYIEEQFLNSSTQVFSLANTPISLIKVDKNGLGQALTEDYTISGATVTFVAGNVNSNDDIIIGYFY